MIFKPLKFRGFILKNNNLKKNKPMKKTINTLIYFLIAISITATAQRTDIQISSDADNQSKYYGQTEIYKSIKVIREVNEELTSTLIDSVNTLISDSLSGTSYSLPYKVARFTGLAVPVGMDVPFTLNTPFAENTLASTLTGSRVSEGVFKISGSAGVFGNDVDKVYINATTRPYNGNPRFLNAYYQDDNDIYIYSYGVEAGLTDTLNTTMFEIIVYQ